MRQKVSCRIYVFLHRCHYFILLVSNEYFDTVEFCEPKMRIELTTYALRVRCSTPELPGRVIRWSVYWRNPVQHHERWAMQEERLKQEFLVHV